MKIREGGMELEKDWNEIRKVFEEGLKTSHHYAVATVNPDGSPHVTPIGSLMLDDDCKGVYCEEFPKNMPRNLAHDQRVCVMALNNGLLFWLKSLFTGRFKKPVGVRLMGVAGKRREATPEESARWMKRVRPFRGLKGHDLLWKNLKHVREIHFDSCEPIRMGKMTRGL